MFGINGNAAARMGSRVDKQRRADDAARIAVSGPGRFTAPNRHRDGGLRGCRVAGRGAWTTRRWGDELAKSSVFLWGVGQSAWSKPHTICEKGEVLSGCAGFDLDKTGARQKPRVRSRLRRKPVIYRGFAGRVYDFEYTGP
jgi:hypothetical protein